MRERNSSIELLKLFAIIMIVFCHAVPVSLDLYQTDVANRLLLTLMRYGGQIANAIFIVCSVWFLCDSVSYHLQKIKYLIANCFVISVLNLGLFLIGGGVQGISHRNIETVFSVDF